MAIRIERSHACIERGEELVFSKHVAVRERVQKRGFSGVRVADERDFQHVFAAGALDFALALDGVEAFFQEWKCDL